MLQVLANFGIGTLPELHERLRRSTTICRRWRSGLWIGIREALEEEAIASYTEYLAEIESGQIENVAAPQIAIDYWKLGSDARLEDVVIAVRADEAGHRDVNHGFADELSQGRQSSS